MSVKRDSDVTDPGTAPDVLTYEPPTDDPSVLALLGNLDTNRAPPPVDVPVTGGELAATYAVSKRLPPRSTTDPTPQPPVIVQPTSHTIRMRVPKALLGRNDPTIRIERQALEAVARPRRIYLIVGGVCGAAIATLGFALLTFFMRRPVPPVMPIAQPVAVPVVIPSAIPSTEPPVLPPVVPTETARATPRATRRAAPPPPPPVPTHTAEVIPNADLLR